MDAAADGDQSSILRISQFVLAAEIAQPDKQAPIIIGKTQQAIAEGNPKQPSHPTRHRPPAPYPGATPVLARPHLQISGRRHVPKLINAHRLPMLRFKKPQSPFVSRVIRDKIAKKIALFQQVEALKDWREIADLEDSWDRLLSRMHGVPDFETNEEMSWASGYDSSISARLKMLTKFEDANKALADKMLDIVNKEKELAEKERLQRKGTKYRLNARFEGDSSKIEQEHRRVPTVLRIRRYAGMSSI